MKKTEKEVKAVNFPVDLLTEIYKFQEDNYIASFTAAVIELIRRGLKSSKN